MPRDELVRTIAYVLSRDRRFWPKKPAHADEPAYAVMAQRIVAHLELCGMEWLQRPPQEAHSAPAMLPRKE